MPAHNENVAGLNIVAGSYSNEQWLVEAPQAEKIRGSERGIRGGSEGIRVTSADDGSCKQAAHTVRAEENVRGERQRFFYPFLTNLVWSMVWSVVRKIVLVFWIKSSFSVEGH